VDDRPVRFVPTGSGTFRVRPIVLGLRMPTLIDGLELRFADVHGEALLQAGGGNGAFMTVGARIDDPGDLAAWQPHVGEWTARDDRPQDVLGLSAATIEDRGDHLRLVVELFTPTSEGTSEYVLVPLDAQRARIGGIGRGLGDVVTIADGTMTAFGVRFVR
jgi:hypothetical protein